MICEVIGLDYEHSDKVDHALVGAVAGATTSLIVERIAPDLRPIERAVIVLIPVVLLAVGKEVYDHQHPDDHTSDWHDGAATIAGGVIAIGISLRF